MRELRVVRRRLIQAVPIVLGIIVINFLLMQLAPGDVVDIIAAGAQTANNPEYLADLRRRYGLDQPTWRQLANYVFQLVQFDLGFSIREGLPVRDLILARLWPTVLLMSASVALAFGIGVLVGVAAARRAHSLADNVISVLNLLFYATPNFWFALMLIILLSVDLGWLPVGGYRTPGAAFGPFAAAWDVFVHLLMPMISLSLIYVAIYTRLMRTSVIGVYDLDFIRTARAKGVTERRVAYHHAVRNALLPMVTYVGLQTGSMLGGAVVVETVFAWPGIGSMALESVAQRDVNLLLGILFMSSMLVIVVNIVVDLVYVRLDPRISLS